MAATTWMPPQLHAAECVQRLEDEVAMLAHLGIEVLRDAAARDVLDRFGQRRF